MHRLLILIALVVGAVSPAAGVVGSSASAATAAKNDNGGLGIRLVDAPVATQDDPRARVYIIDHVQPGTKVERRIEVSSYSGEATDIAVYPAAAAIKGSSFVGLDGDTPNELSNWTTISTSRLGLAANSKQMVSVTIDVPDDATSGEHYAVLWAQTTSDNGGPITQVSRVGIRVYLSVGPGGSPASAFEITSLTAERDASGTPVVAALVRNTGGRALDLRGELTLSDGPGGLSAGPFPVELGTTLGLDASAPAMVRFDKQLPDGPWKAHLKVTSGLLTESAEATLTFTDSGQTVQVSDGTGIWWWLGGGFGILVLCVVGAGLRIRRGPSGHRTFSRPDSSR